MVLDIKGILREGGTLIGDPLESSLAAPHDVEYTVTT